VTIYVKQQFFLTAGKENDHGTGKSEVIYAAGEKPQALMKLTMALLRNLSIYEKKIPGFPGIKIHTKRAFYFLGITSMITVRL
jgi:hypothetical protein